MKCLCSSVRTCVGLWGFWRWKHRWKDGLCLTTYMNNQRGENIRENFSDCLPFIFIFIFIFKRVKKPTTFTRKPCISEKFQYGCVADTIYEATHPFDWQSESLYASMTFLSIGMAQRPFRIRIIIHCIRTKIGLHRKCVANDLIVGYFVSTIQ